MSALIRLIIADDHAVVREGLVALLEEEADLEVIGQAGNGTEAVALVRQHRPDIALLDITLFSPCTKKPSSLKPCVPVPPVTCSKGFTAR